MLRWFSGLLLALGLFANCQADEVQLLAQAAWLEAGQNASIEQASTQFAPRFAPTTDSRIYPLGPGKTLWLRLKLQAGSASPDLGLDIPVPLLDFVTVYQQGADGKWLAQSAGDSLPVASWKRPGRYPSFDVTLPTGAPRDIYLQVRHSDPIGFDVRIGSAGALEQNRQIEYLVLGVILGTLLLLAMLCLIQSIIHRDISYAWYALYAVTMALTRATMSGMSGHLLWNHSPQWADTAQGALPVLLAGVTVLFLHHLCGISARHPGMGRVALACGWAIVLMGLGYVLADSQLQSYVVSFSLVTAAVLSLTMAVLAWRHHDAVGGWVILAYIPLVLTAVVSLMRLNGLIAATWLTFDGASAASAVSVPLLLLALHARSRYRHGAMARVNKLTEQDALTGLLSAEAFERQLKTSVSGALMRRHFDAVMLVDVVNLPKIRQSYGDAMAEQCVLRAVIKLHRVVRESDPAGRIDTGRFGLIFEGTHSRAELQERMVRLVASGLVPPRGAGLEVPLQMHVACLLLGEKVLAPAQILRELGQVLAGMSSRTRRPVRFLGPADDAASSQMPPGAPSSSPAPGPESDETQPVP